MRGAWSHRSHRDHLHRAARRHAMRLGRLHDARPRQFRTFCQAVYAPRNGFAAVKLSVDLDGSVFCPCPQGA